jgi:hypothetical protein
MRPTAARRPPSARSESAKKTARIRGDLIKQRLKKVIIPSVDDGHVDGGAGERLGGT